jgi:hypothetical protein
MYCGEQTSRPLRALASAAGALVQRSFSNNTPAGPAAWSTVDHAHISFVVALASGRREIVQPFDLLGVQLDAVGRDVLLDASDPLGAGDRSDVVALREQPRQSDLRLCCRRLGGNGLDLVEMRRLR